jgi:hypothetical protein
MLKSAEPFALAGIYAMSGDHQFGEAESAPVTFGGNGLIGILMIIVLVLLLTGPL